MSSLDLGGHLADGLRVWRIRIRGTPVPARSSA